ncbi:hypothetical protein PAXRUDRAFT_19159 [Paxillus rubicundulus Ve08.2h10]|uniref:Uncharacterized protein n=1 Tax=Paxillus rubicundulus Ve08.2h10 TaxID=930991 RepID=A0A0D0DD13_9AGAM|nr:hypothetical protein PAXRUDRAFT_19159 [Paxillus rubicundulus Ve08.2h10]
MEIPPSSCGAEPQAPMSNNKDVSVTQLLAHCSDEGACTPGSSTGDPQMMNKPVCQSPMTMATAAPAINFLDLTANDNDDMEVESVCNTVKRLIVEAKKFKSFASLLHLHALKQFIEL